MGQKQCRRKGAKNKQHNKKLKLKRYTRDIDQIVYEDFLPEMTEKLLNQPLDEDLPGLGQFYCLPCARYFTTQAGLSEHLLTKLHKKRFKVVTTETPYTIEESELVAGLRPAVKGV
jgi:bud site selection protein 20